MKIGIGSVAAVATGSYERRSSQYAAGIPSGSSDTGVDGDSDDDSASAACCRTRSRAAAACGSAPPTGITNCRNAGRKNGC